MELDNYFEQYWETFVQKLFEEDWITILKKEKQRYQQQFENLKLKKQSESEMQVEKAVESQENLTVHEPESEPEKMETDKEEDEKNSILKLVCLETIGKCWPYSTEIQGRF